MFTDKFLTLKITYIIVFISLMLWALFAFFTMNQLIDSQEKYANIINISGKQRMLSQKTTLLVKRVFETKDKKLVSHSIALSSLMENDHKFLLNNLTSTHMQKIYFNEPYALDNKVKKYLKMLDEFHTKPSQNIVKKIENYSFDLLPKLNYAVYEFEKEANKKIAELKQRELYILIGTLITIILEALLIVLPSLRSIKMKEKKLKEVNKSLENRIAKEIEKVRKQEQVLAKNSKLSSMADMIDNIAHQWRQPLSIISTNATTLEYKQELNVLKDGDIKNTCTQINENAQYLSQTIENLKQYLDGDSIPVQFNLKNNSDKFLKLIESTIEKHHVQIFLNLKEDIKVQGYPNELIECFINIFNNSKDAFVEQNYPKDNRFIFISQEVINDHIVISFKDNAGGINEDILSRVFEPYFTTKHQSIGTGLGLSMTYNLIVNGMNGEIDLHNIEFECNGSTQKGVEFIITLPIE